MSRRAQMLFVVWFITTLFIVPISQAGLEIASGNVPQCLDLFRTIPTSANFRSFERSLESASWYATAIRPWMQTFWFMTLRNPGEKAIAGADGWLFYKPDVRYLVEGDEDRRDATEKPLTVITAFRDELAGRGIHLLVVPMPGKPSIYADKLTGRAKADGAFRSRTLDMIAQLRAHGVETFDLFTPFQELRLRQPSEGLPQPYLRRDTHWSGTTCSFAAGLIASKLRDLQWDPPATKEYDERPVTVKRRGDLIRMIGGSQLDYFYPVEDVACLQVAERITGKLYKDDPLSPVLVLGDSFLRMYQTDEPRSAGFIAHLARELGAPVASIVNDGGASTLVRKELMRRPQLLVSKRVVIWEFVERDLIFGTDGWKNVPLPEKNHDPDVAPASRNSLRSRSEHN